MNNYKTFSIYDECSDLVDSGTSTHYNINEDGEYIITSLDSENNYAFKAYQILTNEARADLLDQIGEWLDMDDRAYQTEFGIYRPNPISPLKAKRLTYIPDRFNPVYTFTVVHNL